MGRLVSSLLAALALSSTAVEGRRPAIKTLLVPPSDAEDGSATEFSDFAAPEIYTFQQYIDHKNPELGTFSQQYWVNSDNWKGPGSPVVFFTPGEIAAAGYTGYLTNLTITGKFAEAIGGAVVMLEHRYYGGSSPYQNLTSKTLQYLDLDQAIADNTYFAKTVSLPFDPTNSSQADKAPWVFSGGSYSGALSAWTEKLDPGTFWAYHASSAPVQAISDYWQYFVPVQQGMPKNCSKDIDLVVNYLDKILMNPYTSNSKKDSIKDRFGLKGLRDDDFMGALEWGPWLWQSNSFTTNYSGFFQFCDYIENAAAAQQTNGTTAPAPTADGVGLNKALSGYAVWFKTVYLPGFCRDSFGYWDDEMSIACFNTYDKDSKMYTDTSVGNTFNRQWMWFLCNEPFGYWQNGAPKGTPTLVSRMIKDSYWTRQCGLFFPPEGEYTYGLNKGRTAEQINAKTEGWFLTDTTRLIWSNGQFDPWRESGVSSDFRPGGPLPSRPEAPLNVIPGGFHCSDLRIRNGQANEGVMKIIDAEIAQIKEWVSEYK